MSKILVSGSPGQAAWFLANDLSQNPSNEVYLSYRYSSTPFSQRFAGWEDILERPNVHSFTLDITDSSGIMDWVRLNSPDKIFNAAALSHVGESFKNPHAVFAVNTHSVISFLEAIRQFSPRTKFLQFSTSEMFGSNFSQRNEGSFFDREVVRFQDEGTPFSPNSPYAASKVAAHEMVRLYREAYNLNVNSIITFNYESERRGEQFVTRKITKWVANFKRFLKDNGPYFEDSLSVSGDNLKLINSKGEEMSYPRLRLGNVDAKRDWSYAGDSMRAAQIAIGSGADYVICSERTHSVRDFLTEAFKVAHLHRYAPETFFLVDPQFYRPCEVEYLRGSSRKIRQDLGWAPTYSFSDLVRTMVEADLEEVGLDLD